MTTQLKLYNRACQFLGETRLASLTENRIVRFELDDVWEDGGVRRCLEAGLWNFAMRSVEVSYDPDVTPDFGYQYAFSKPSDWVRTAAMCSDEYFQVPLLAYVDEQDYWYCDLDTIYISYVSDDSNYGGDLSRWPETFADYAAMYFAVRVAPVLMKNNTRGRQALKKELRRTLIDAKNKDAMNEPVKFPAEGSWSRSRRGNTSRLDRGSRSVLMG